MLTPTMQHPILQHLATALLSGLLLAGAVPLSGKAQAAGPTTGCAERGASTEVMILGTFHFGSAPGFADVMAPEQQAEIRAVVDSLADFRPTKIALEEVIEDVSTLDSLYSAYRAGSHALTRNERQQLGFRLAAQMGHTQVYAIDHKKPWPNQKAVAWAREYRPAFLTYYRDWREQRRAEYDSLFRNASIREILRHMNTRQHLLRLEELRMRKLELGAGSKYPGIAPVRSVYERDFHIFANLTRMAEPGDRILVIYGAGHVYHLRNFIRAHPDLRLAPVRDYL